MIDMIEDNGFRYLETNPESDKTILLLHGLFGGMSNFSGIINGFPEYNVILPDLPIYDMPTEDTGLDGLHKFVQDFIAYKTLSNIHLVGNSLGGHIAQLVALSDQDKLATMTLTGSSGLFESGMGDGYPRRGDYDYIKAKTEETFYDPAVATKELVDECFGILNDRNKAIRIIITAKSAIRHNTGDTIHNITIPTLLIWGAQDTITPPFVAKKFNELIPNSELHFIDKCCHAPMMECPEEFNTLLSAFLDNQK